MYQIDRRGGAGGGSKNRILGQTLYPQKSFTRTDPRLYLTNRLLNFDILLESKMCIT